MAVLETIRSYKTLLFGIIIVALLAFILGDFLTSGRTFMGDNNTVVKAGDVKVEYPEYSKALDEASRAQQNQRQDNDELHKQVLDQLLMQKLINQQIDKLGVKVTDQEITRVMTQMPPMGPAGQFVAALAQNLNLPANADGAMVYDAIKNPGKYNLRSEDLNNFASQVFQQPTLVDAWARMEKDAENMIRQQAFYRLYSGLFTANDLDAQSLYNDNFNTTVVAYTTKALGLEDVEVTDADRLAKWEQTKYMYALPEETRAIDYIVVNVRPSAEDLEAADAEVEATVADLEAQEGLNGLTGHSNFMSETVNTRIDQIKKNADLRMMPDSAVKVGKVHKFNLNRGTNTYTITKVLNIAPVVDSVKVSYALVANKAEADSLLGVINGGKAWSEVGMEVDTWLPLHQMSVNRGISDDLKNQLISHSVGQNFVYNDTVTGLCGVFVINERRAPVDYADIAVIKYSVSPSSTTVANLKKDLNSFRASNPKADMFSAKGDSLYNLMHGQVTERSPHIANLANSRAAVKWAMEAKPGEVSEVYDNRDYYLVIALKDVYDKGYIPANAAVLQDILTQEAMVDKRAATAIEQYAGKAKSVEEYAQLMGTEVRTDSALIFGSYSGNGINHYAVQGAIAGAADGTIVGPIQGNNEIVVFQVLGHNTQGRPFIPSQDRNRFVNTFQFNNPNALFLGNRKVKDYTLKREAVNQE